MAGVGLTDAAGAHCPSCERFIGPVDACPYCDADSARAPVYRRLRWWSLGLGVVGLFWLWLSATARPAPLVRAGEVTPTMNFAYVRVRGAVARRPYRARRAGRLDYVSFLVDDGTGGLRVAARGRVARAAEAAGRLPRAGDRVEAAGSLRVGGDGSARLYLQSVDGLRQLRSAEGGS